MVPRRVPWTIVVLAFAVPLVFAAVTHHAWEDYFITLRTSRNLVEGNGLVFTPGERVHTFTSPLGVLVPALCTAIAGIAHETRALWLFRIIDAAALAAVAAMIWHRLKTLQLGALGRLVVLGFVIGDAKLADFSINGMETALLVLFTVWLWSELEAPTGPRVPPVACALAGLLWTRPDAFILGGALLVASFCFRSGQTESHSKLPDANRAAIVGRPSWIRLTTAIIIAGALYLPWFVFAWWYYGSPVPHTITAKAAYTAHPSIGGLLEIPWQTFLGNSSLMDLFLPSYWIFGGWPALLSRFAHVLVVLAAFVWLIPRWPAAGRRASLVVFVGMFYLCSIILFPWYVPPWTVLAAIALGFLADAIHIRLSRHSSLAALWRIGCVVAVTLQIGMLAAVAWQMRIHQRYVEDGVRRNIGEWLHANAGPRDTVFLEPLGYIGYYSNLKTYDFPGLSSPQVVDVVRHGGRRYTDIIARLQPTWLVLRPAEVARSEFRNNPLLIRDYTLVRTWDGLPELDRISFLPGRPWVEWESRFLLFRRRDSGSVQ